jgi:hypothetical protein
LVVLLLAISLPASVGAASKEFEEFKAEISRDAHNLKSEFKTYKDKQDAEFADFLKSTWREFDTFSGVKRIKEPKPKQVPVVVPVVVPTIPNQPLVKPAPIVPPVVVVPIIPPVVPAPPPPQPKPVPLAADRLEIAFFGNQVNFNFDPQWKAYRLTSGVKPDTMSDFWTMMSGSKYEPTIEAVNAARHDLKLDDWGYVSLWREVVRSLQPERKAEQNLLLWYFLIKSGYDVRLGYASSDVHLFVAIKQQVFSTKSIKVADQKYYAVLATDRGDSISRFYTYDAKYPGNLNQLDIQSASTGFTKTVSAQRALAFEYKGETIKLNVPYDRRLVEYMQTFPQSDFELYFDTDGSALLRQSLLTELRKHTARMEEEEAVNFLLAFVQKAFAYKTDEEQFGYEKYFFIEESLYFPFNDCEDRAVLFAWLAHELVGLKAVGLLYPNHMTTAVLLKNVKTEFSTVDFHGERFVIADPTYIGASVGMAMPSYVNLKPTRVVEIH